MATQLTLFWAGDAPESRRIAMAIREWCEGHLEGDYRLDVLDVGRYPERAEAAEVLATPQLVLDAPPARVVGNLSDMARVMIALGLAAS